MAARTSSQSGVWSASSTWGGSAAPTSADTATIANGHTVTLDADAAVGGNQATYTAGLTINASGQLNLGGFQLASNSSIECAARASATYAIVGTDNSGIEFTNGAGTQQRIRLQTNAGISLVGSSATVGRPYIRTAAANAIADRAYIFKNGGGTLLTWTNADYLRMGKAANPGDGTYAALNSFVAGATDVFTFTRVKFDTCGVIHLNSQNAAATYIFDYCQFVNGVDTVVSGAAGAYLQSSDSVTATGTWRIKNCWSDGLKTIYPQGGRNWDMRGNIFRGHFGGLPVPAVVTGSLSANHYCQGNLFIPESSANSLKIPINAANNYIFSEPIYLSGSGDGNFHTTNWGGLNGGTSTVSGNIHEHSQGTDGSDSEYNAMPAWSVGQGGALVVNSDLCLPPGLDAATIDSWQLSSDLTTSITLKHVTTCGNGRPTYIGETLRGFADQISAYESNLFYVTRNLPTYKLTNVDGSASYVADVVSPAGIKKNAAPLFTATTAEARAINNANGYASRFTTTPDGTDISAAPNFYAPLRCLPMFDTGYLGDAQSTAWADATSYAVGDEVSAATSGFFNGQTINYRCKTAHTSNAANTTNGKPGVPANTSWRTNWEFRVISRIGNALIAGMTLDASALALWGGSATSTYIEAAMAWVKQGRAPTNPLYRNAGQDGATIGAVEGVFATGFTFTGPSTGRIGVASTNFTVTPNGNYSGTVTPSDGGAGGTFTPSSLDWSANLDNSAKTFTYTPASGGTKTISLANSWSLTAPSNLSYVATASSYTMTGPGSGTAGSPSTNFTVTPNAAYTGTITPSDGGGGGTFTPSSLTFTASAVAQTFTYTAASAGTKTISATNNGSLTNPSNLSYVAAAASGGSYYGLPFNPATTIVRIRMPARRR